VLTIIHFFAACSAVCFSSPYFGFGLFFSLSVFSPLLFSAYSAFAAFAAFYASNFAFFSYSCCSANFYIDKSSI
jgi:hypothetical protein